MTTDKNGSIRKIDRTFVKIIIAVICVVVLNAGMNLATAFSIQSRYDSIRAQQQRQSLSIFSNLCRTLDSLHADQPPEGDSVNNPSRAYLQELHNRLGELAIDIKCP